jgi:hypothetical protein
MILRTTTKKEVEKIGIKSKQTIPAKISKTNTIIIGLIVTFIFGYIIYDHFIFKPKINAKITAVSTKFDSLKTHLNAKLPEIEKAIEIQKQQVKDLQQISTTYKKK